MRILMTSIVDLKKSQHNRAHEFLKHLSKKNEVTVLSINDWWKGRQGELESYIDEFSHVFSRVDYRYLTEKRLSPVFQELFLRKSLKEVVKEGFEVHFNYNSLVVGYEAAKRVKTVFDVADDLVAMIKESPQVPGLLRPFGGYFGQLLLRKNIQEAEKVTLTTEVLKENYGITNHKVEIVPNGVDTNLFRYYDQAKEELGLDGFIIGYVGVLREWVNLEPVFRALRWLVKDIRMIVVGKEGRFLENIALARKYGIEDRVVFTGTLPYSLVPKYISAMDVCLIPFESNAISQGAVPLKLFEYIACGRPVISSEIPGVKTVVGDNVLYASNEREYSEKILMLYRDGSLRDRLGGKAREIVEENYAWDKIATRLEQILLGVGS